jgi:Zn-dependent protease
VTTDATTCNECGAQIGSGLLACPGCARLLHRSELNALAATAKAAEARSDLTAALTAWRRASELLPAGTVQHDTVHKRMQALSAAIDGRGPAPAPLNPQKGAKTGVAVAVGTAGLALLKSKALLGALVANSKLLLVGLLKLPTLLSMMVYTQWMGRSGLGFGLGLVLSLYVHEVGHVAALRRYGIAASAPMFIPGFGAFVRLDQYPTDAHEEARTGLAGPLWGLCAAAAAALLGTLAASPLAISIASVGASINLFNLIPVWMLDGARGMRALDRSQRFVVAGAAAACALLLHQWMPGFVAAIAFARAFGSDVHASGDRSMLVLFVALLVLLSLLASLPVTHSFT